ncbi:Fc.00g060890.m01.CDS01 [Cosmosporella sp. VM-42]
MLSHATKFISWGLLALSFFTTRGVGFSWGLDRRANGGAPSAYEEARPRFASQAVPIPLADRYTAALNELQELESKPLCHRIAARLLVNNCQLVNGQDETLTRTDTDRAARDFVDAYAIGLAICDLERGSFRIPPTCSQFQESTLATIPVPVRPQLHVSTQDITECLRDLAHSDSAWNTWVNYRHQAVRFCEASLAENKKDHDIRLYQRLTKILEKITTQIEVDMEARLQSLNRMFQEASDSVENLVPKVNHLETRLRMVDDIIGGQIARTAQESNSLMKSGLEHAGSLQQLLSALIKAVIENAAEVAATHETSLQAATRQANDEIADVMAALASAALSSASLQNQMEISHAHVTEISLKQARIEVGLDRLGELADALSVKYDTHDGRLERAQEKAEKILGILDNATTSALIFRSSMFSGFGLSGWWPYILCPAASLVMGSYGLEPSAMRNIWLVGLGEIVGFIISIANHYANIFFSSEAQQDQTPFNTTFDTSASIHDFSNVLRESGFKRHIFARE